MSADPEDTHAVYEWQATEYDKLRSKSLFEARWLARFTASLKPGDHVLDLGCGTRDPIARWFMAEGFAVTGVDFAEAMLAMAHERWPDGDCGFGTFAGFGAVDPQIAYAKLTALSEGAKLASA